MQKAGKRERIVKIDDAPGQPFDHGIFGIEVEDLPATPKMEMKDE